MPKWKSLRWEAFNTIRKQAHEQKKSAANHLPHSHYPSFSDVHHFLFFHLAFLSYSFWSPHPSHFLAHVYLRCSHFFLCTFSLIHSLYLFLIPLSLRLSGHPLLFYNSNGSNVKEKRPAAFPPVGFTIKVFDQFVTGASDRASTLQHYPQQEH